MEEEEEGRQRRLRHALGALIVSIARCWGQPSDLRAMLDQCVVTDVEADAKNRTPPPPSSAPPRSTDNATTTDSNHHATSRLRLSPGPLSLLLAATRPMAPRWHTAGCAPGRSLCRSLRRERAAARAGLHDRVLGAPSGAVRTPTRGSLRRGPVRRGAWGGGRGKGGGGGEEAAAHTREVESRSSRCTSWRPSTRSRLPPRTCATRGEAWLSSVCRREPTSASRAVG